MKTNALANPFTCMVSLVIGMLWLDRGAYADHHMVRESSEEDVVGDIVDKGEFKVERPGVGRQIVLPAQPLGRQDGCAVNLKLRYGQRHTHVRVTTTIEPVQCAPAEGAYTLIVDTVNAAGERRTREIRETWFREVDTPLDRTLDIDLEGDPTLRRVRVKKSAKDDCTCLPPDDGGSG